MKNLFTLLLCIITFTASANQAQVVGARIGNTTLTSSGTSCVSIPYSGNGYDIFVLIKQVSNNSTANITGVANYTTSSITQSVQGTTNNVSLIQSTTVAILVGHINLLPSVVYNFAFNAKVCYTNNCDSNSNNAIGDSFTFCITQNVPLPVELTSFTASNTAQATRLNWTTASEKNTERFSIQSSNDGASFREIGSVQANGNSTSQHNYSFVNNRVDGLTYYRLKTIDKDNTFSFSPVISVTPTSLGAEYLAGVQGRFVAFHLAPNETPVKLYVLDTTGRTLYEQDFDQIIRYPLGERMVIIRMVTNTGNQYSKLYR